eukprot:365940-Chlamydomonas_euryale.AAC.20
MSCSFPKAHMHARMHGPPALRIDTQHPGSQGIWKSSPAYNLHAFHDGCVNGSFLAGSDTVRTIEDDPFTLQVLGKDGLRRCLNVENTISTERNIENYLQNVALFIIPIIWMISLYGPRWEGTFRNVSTWSSGQRTRIEKEKIPAPPVSESKMAVTRTEIMIYFCASKFNIPFILFLECTSLSNVQCAMLEFLN